MRAPERYRACVRAASRTSSMRSCQGMGIPPGAAPILAGVASLRRAMGVNSVALRRGSISASADPGRNIPLSGPAGAPHRPDQLGAWALGRGLRPEGVLGRQACPYLDTVTVGGENGAVQQPDAFLVQLAQVRLAELQEPPQTPYVVRLQLRAPVIAPGQRTAAGGEFDGLSGLVHGCSRTGVFR